MATIGLDKLYYAKITEDTSGNETYEDPLPLAKAMTAELSVELAEATLYADDGAAEQVVIQLGYENNPGEAIDLGCNEWARLVEEKSGGTMKIEVFPSSQLGAKVDLIDQMLAGAPVITLADGAFYADRGVPDFGILFGPYLFSDWEEDADGERSLCRSVQ